MSDLTYLEGYINVKEAVITGIAAVVLAFVAACQSDPVVKELFCRLWKEFGLQNSPEFRMRLPCWLPAVTLTPLSFRCYNRLALWHTNRGKRAW